MARMPYTNFHDINLDWLIKRVMPAYTPDNPPPYPVKSVNGKTGAVQLTGGDIPFSEDSPQVSVRDFCDFALEQLENLNRDMFSKQDAPVLAGSPGQVLSLDADQNPVWSNPAGGTDDYDDLQNKPQINGVTVAGNKTGTDFGLLNASFARMMYAPIITNTASGDPANFPDGIADMPMDVLANIEPVQDLNGYGYPWSAGRGPNVWNEETIFGYFNDSGVWTIRNDILSSKNAIKVTPSETYYIVCPNATFVTYWKSEVTPDNAPASEFISRSQVTNYTHQLNIPANCNYIFFNLPTAYGTTYNNDVSVNYPASITSYRPYSNICPISGNAGLTLYTSGADTSDPDVYLVAWGDVAGTVYGGTFNSKTGKLIVTDANIASYNGETLPSTWISDRDVYAPGIPPTNGAQVVYKLAQPIEYDLYNFDLKSVYGDNNIWTDVGPVSVDYYADTKLYIDKQVAALQALILEI